MKLLSRENQLQLASLWDGSMPPMSFPSLILGIACESATSSKIFRALSMSLLSEH
jgi:hypothetical protein